MIWALLAIAVIWLIWFVAGLSGGAARLKDAERELDEWSGVTDVRRKTRDSLNDIDYVERVQDEFNDK